MELTAPVQYLKGVGPTRAKMFENLGVYTAGDLLRTYPRSYENWQDTCTIADAPTDGAVCIKAVVARPVAEHLVKGGRIIAKTTIADGKSLMGITFFNNRYVKDQLSVGEEYLFFGRVQDDIYNGKGMLSPRFVKAEGGGGLHPIYRQTQTLTSNIIAKCVRAALESCADAVTETLPSYIIEKYRLAGLQDALRMIHFPQNEEDIIAARRRFIYEELLQLQLGLLDVRADRKRGQAFPVTRDCTPGFRRLLPFRMTGAQERAIAECLSDMKKEVPMRRLLQGDVGSGKTAVAAALAYSVISAGCQTAVMAPTEVLAEQHSRTFERFFAGTPVRSALLTGAMKASEKKKIKTALAQGEIDLLIGTHAILQNDVVFPRLGLVITDEQHRFGVAQRAALREKGGSPHVLVMSATPIPRTVALVMYGDLDISVLDELPAGRKPIRTYSVGSSFRNRVYAFIRKQLDAGGQAYIVCPLVEDGEETMPDRQSAQQLYKNLAAGEFAAYNPGLLHGKMKPKEKETVMRRFSEGEVRLLVCTVVVEVGIDVPNACVMVIENAECFGLSQLHQLRGRIGRGERQSYCILLSDAQTEQSVQRFRTMCETNDGFVVADRDLQMRGPGDFFGEKQHGLPTLKIADLATDSRILHAAQSDAKQILADDPMLSKPENLLLKQQTEALFADIS